MNDNYQFALEIKATSLFIFLEGILLRECLRSISNETVEIMLLVDYRDYDHIYHEFQYTDEKLKFCKQKLSVLSLFDHLSTAGVSNPTELEFGNSSFHFKQYFPSAYMIQFYEGQHSSIYKAFMKGIMGDSDFTTTQQQLSLTGKAASEGLRSAFAGISLHQLMEQRFESWHEKTVADYERFLSGRK